MPKIEQIPILLLTGFLGAGKTTLLAKWLKAPELEGALAIVNELGEVGLDHRLLEASTDVPLLLENGCMCCAAQEDTIGTLERMFWDRLHKRTQRFGWVLIETTGMADPKPVIAAIRRHNLVGERYRIAGVVTAVDAKRGLERLADFPECRNQLDVADVVIVTKTDLASPDEIARVTAAMPAKAPHARVVMSANGELPAATLLEMLAHCTACGSHGHGEEHHHGHDHASSVSDPLGLTPEFDVKGERTASTDHRGAALVSDPSSRRQASHEGQTPNSHEHDHHRIEAEHADSVTTAFLPVPKSVGWGALIAALDTLLQGHADTLLRLKGIVRLDEAPGYHAVQATPGQGITRTEIPIDDGDEPPRTGFTLIVFHEPAAGVASSLASLIAIKQAVARNAVDARA